MCFDFQSTSIEKSFPDVFITTDELHIRETGFNPRSSHDKDSKMVLDASSLNTQHYKVRIKGKVEQFMERSSALPYTLVE